MAALPRRGATHEREDVRAIRLLREAMRTQQQGFTTVATLSDFAESLVRSIMSQPQLVGVSFGPIEARLVIMAIDSDQPWNASAGQYVDFRAWAIFGDGSDMRVSGRYFHWRGRGPLHGFAYESTDKYVDPVAEFHIAHQ